MVVWIGNYDRGNWRRHDDIHHQQESLEQGFRRFPASRYGCTRLSAPQDVGQLGKQPGT